jgi:hypothetical protein
MDMGMPANAGKAVEALGREGPAISGGITLPGRRFRVEKEDHRWADYGIVRYYGVFIDETGEETPRHYQLIVIDTKHPAMGKPLKATLVKSPFFQFIPNEVALEAADAVAESLGIRRDGVEWTGNGLGVYARYVGDRAQDVVPGDPVAIGFQMKNSVDGSISYTYTGYILRLVCKNGAVAPTEQTTLKVRWSSDPPSVEDLREDLGRIMGALQEEVDAYREWTKIQVNIRLARMLAAALPKSYLTGFVEFDKKTHEVVDVKPLTLWEAFNTITDPLTHRRIEARHRDWLRIRLRRTLDLWQAVEEGRLSEEDVMRNMVGGEE